jgi:GT2 family glycosyltransferase
MSNKTPLVSVIILNWNGKKFIEKCIRSLMNVSYPSIEILFIDNASTDGSPELIETKYRNIKVFRNKKNLGFAEGHEIGFRKAHGNAILLLNTDTIVEENLITSLVNVLYSKKSIGAVQPKIVMYPQKEIIDSIGVFFLMNGSLYHYGREKKENILEYNKQMEIFSAKGVCVMFKKEVLDKTGFFDKDYFAYFEETDICMRVWLSGYKIVYTPTSTVYHIGGATSKRLNWSFILFHSYKNGISTYIKNLSPSYLLRVLPVMLFLYQGVFLLHLLRLEFSNALAVQRAIIWNIIHFEKTLRKRQRVQNKIRRIKDDEYLPKLTRKVKWSYYYYQFFGGMGKYI